MTLNLALTGLAASYPIPGVYIEVRFAQGQSAGDLGAKTVLLLAPKSSAGGATPDTRVYGPYSDEADLITDGGPGSPAHRMGRTFLGDCKTAQLYVLYVTETTGSAATDVITFATNPTGVGVATATIAGETVAYGFTASDTPTTIAAGIAAAVNQITRLPVSATSSAGVVTLTGKVAGKDLNSVRYSASVTAGRALTVVPTADTALGASTQTNAAIGTGTTSYTAALATILGRRFHYLVPHTQDTTVLQAVLAQVGNQALPGTGFLQKVIAGTSLTPSAAGTLGAAINQELLRIANQNQAPYEHYVLAALHAAAIYNNAVPDPAFNFDGYGANAGDVFSAKRPVNDSALPSAADLVTMLNSGITPIAATAGGTAYIVRGVTTRCRDASNNNDFRVRDAHIVEVAHRFADDSRVRLATAGWKTVAEDPANVDKQPPAKAATPSRVKAVLEQEVSDYVDANYLDPGMKAEMLASMQVGVDPVVKTVINVRVPLYAVKLLHAVRELVAESSPAA